MGINRKFVLKSRFCFIPPHGKTIGGAKLLVQPQLLGCQFDSLEVFRDGIVVALSLGSGLCEHLVYAPGFGIRLEHSFIAIPGYQQMSLAAVIKNVRIVRRKLCGSVQGVGGFFRMFGLPRF